MEYAVSRLTTDVSRVFKDTHVRTLLTATYDNAMSMSELFRLIGARLRDERWIVVLKSLSLIHLLAREGNSERILGYLCANTDVLYQSFFRQHGPVSTKIMKGYSAYLEEKAGAYRALKYDWVRKQDEAVARFRSMDDENQLIKEAEMLQKQIQTSLGCAWECDGTTDIVIQQAFRFILAEYFTLFLLGNESIVKVLGLYFQMERKNATKALELYKTFVTQTKRFQDIFKMAKQNLPMRVDIPNFNVPPVELVKKLEDYLNSPDHEDKRIAAKSGKTHKESNSEQIQVSFSLGQPPKSQPRNAYISKNPVVAKPLIDFFDSVEEQHDQPTTSPTFSNGWDDQFSQHAAMQSTIQTQIQLTNQLLHSGGGASQQFPAATNGGFSQTGFNNLQQPAMFPPQSSGFAGMDQASYFGQTNPFAQQLQAPSVPSDPFSSLGSSSRPPMNNIPSSNQFTGMSGRFPNSSFAQSTEASNGLGGVPNNSFASHAGTYNNFGGLGSKSFASTAGGFSSNMPLNSPNPSTTFQQQNGANPFIQPAIHNPSAFDVEMSPFSGSNNVISSGNNYPIPLKQGDGAYGSPSMASQPAGSSSGNNNPFAATSNMNGMNGYGNSGSSRQLTPSNIQQQNQGSLVSQFRANQANLNNSVGGGAYNTASIPRGNQGQATFAEQQFQQQNAFTNQHNVQQQSQQSNFQSNHNPFF